MGVYYYLHEVKTCKQTLFKWSISLRHWSLAAALLLLIDVKRNFAASFHLHYGYQFTGEKRGITSERHQLTNVITQSCIRYTWPLPNIVVLDTDCKDNDHGLIEHITLQLYFFLITLFMLRREWTMKSILVSVPFSYPQILNVCDFKLKVHLGYRKLSTYKQGNSIR